MKKDPFLAIIHGANLVWALRIGLLHLRQGSGDVNYLGDPIFLTAVLLVIALHTMRWRYAFRTGVGTTFSSSTDLVKAMRETAETAYKSTPYLPGPVPNQEQLQKRAAEAFENTEAAIAKQPREVFQLVLSVKYLMSMHLVIMVIGFAYLRWGGLPSYAKLLQGIPLLVPLLVAACTGITIYSASTVIYFLVSTSTSKEVDK